MINANELRIGNWVKLFNDDFYKIHVISKTVIQVEGGIIGGEVFKLEHIQPIPLTPEILEKCGFKKGSIYFYFSKFRIVKINDSNNWLILLSDTYHHLCKLKHLHQLQNLYFALTGEELIYKP